MGKLAVGYCTLESANASSSHSHCKQAESLKIAEHVTRALELVYSKADPAKETLVRAGAKAWAGEYSVDSRAIDSLPRYIKHSRS